MAELVVRPMRCLSRILVLASFISIGLSGYSQANEPVPGNPVIEQSADHFSGMWQGTLQANGAVRIVLKVSRSASAGAGGWQGVFYNLDSDAGKYGRTATPMTVQGSALSFTVGSIEGHFQGRLSDDHASIEGTWTQGQASYQLNLARATADTAWALPKYDKLMPADAEPMFEVATIKPTDPNLGRMGFHNEGRHIWCENETPESLIRFAFQVHPKQIAGGPSWFEHDRYTIDGFPDIEGTPNIKQMQGMYRKILEERFKLTLHREQRELPVYAITIAKSGVKLTNSLGDPKGLPDQTGSWGGLHNAIRFTNNSMEDFALMMDYILDRPVVDKTGLPGKFDFYLKWSSDEAPLGDPGAAPGLFTAIQEQLGLKLEPVKAPAEVLVVDHVERPSEN